jgi:hypothetical protein
MELGHWVTTTSFAHPRVSHAGGIHDGRLYVLGGYFYGSDRLTRYQDVQVAQIQQDDTVSSWRQTQAFDKARSGLGLAFHGDFIYITGGDGASGALGDVQFARLGADGGIQKWETSPHRLNTPRSNHASLAVRH